MNRKIIKGAYVISLDPQINNLKQADILIEGKNIAAIQDSIAVEDAEIIDATNMIVMPGFVDTHRHIWQGAIRSVTADWSLLNYLGGIRMSTAAYFRPEDMYAAQYQGGLEAINAGVTTVADYCHNINSPEHAHESIRGLNDSGLRCVWSYGFNRPPLDTPAFNTLDDRIQFARDLASQYFNSTEQLLTMSISPEEIQLWDGVETGKKQFQLASDLNTKAFWHCNVVRNMGQHPGEVQALNDLGLLTKRVVLVHMNYTSPSEWELIKDNNIQVSLTPDTELQMGMGRVATLDALQYSKGPSYGIDIISNNSGDLFFPLRLALQLAREELNRQHDGGFYDGVPLRCQDALEWGTINGARVLGLEDKIGSLSPGKEADIVMLQTDSINMVGWDRDNPAATVIQQASINDVDTVLIAGKVVKRHGKLIEDEAKACKLLNETNNYITAQANSNGGFYLSPEQTFSRMGFA